MKKTRITIVIVVAILSIFCIVLYRWQLKQVVPVKEYQHEINQSADSKIGETMIAEDGTVNPESFVSHLPIVVIETNQETLVSIFDYISKNNIKLNL